MKLDKAHQINQALKKSNTFTSIYDENKTYFSPSNYNWIPSIRSGTTTTGAHPMATKNLHLIEKSLEHEDYFPPRNSWSNSESLGLRSRSSSFHMSAAGNGNHDLSRNSYSRKMMSEKLSFSPATKLGEIRARNEAANQARSYTLDEIRLHKSDGKMKSPEDASRDLDNKFQLEERSSKINKIVLPSDSQVNYFMTEAKIKPPTRMLLPIHSHSVKKDLFQGDYYHINPDFYQHHENYESEEEMDDVIFDEVEFRSSAEMQDLAEKCVSEVIDSVVKLKKKGKRKRKTRKLKVDIPEIAGLEFISSSSEDEEEGEYDLPTGLLAAQAKTVRFSTVSPPTKNPSKKNSIKEDETTPPKGSRSSSVSDHRYFLKQPKFDVGVDWRAPSQDMKNFESKEKLQAKEESIKQNKLKQEKISKKIQKYNKMVITKSIEKSKKAEKLKTLIATTGAISNLHEKVKRKREKLFDKDKPFYRYFVTLQQIDLTVGKEHMLENPDYRCLPALYEIENKFANSRIKIWSIANIETVPGMTVKHVTLCIDLNFMLTKHELFSEDNYPGCLVIDYDEMGTFKEEEDELGNEENDTFNDMEDLKNLKKARGGRKMSELQRINDARYQKLAWDRRQSYHSDPLIVQIETHQDLNPFEIYEFIGLGWKNFAKFGGEY